MNNDTNNSILIPEWRKLLDLLEGILKKQCCKNSWIFIRFDVDETRKRTWPWWIILLMKICLLKDGVRPWECHWGQNQSGNASKEMSRNQLWQPDLLPVILGDFNYDPSERSKLSDYIKSKGLVQIVKEPTHKEGRTLDQCFVPKSLKDCMTLKMFSPYYSDHSGLLMNFL